MVAGGRRKRGEGEREEKRGRGKGKRSKEGGRRKKEEGGKRKGKVECIRGRKTTVGKFLPPSRTVLSYHLTMLQLEQSMVSLLLSLASGQQLLLKGSSLGTRLCM